MITFYPDSSVTYKIMSLYMRWRFQRLSLRHKLNLFADVYHEGLGFSWVKGNYYSSVRPDQLWHVLDKMNITRDDSFLDFGSGRGTALLVASMFRYGQLYGVELSERLYEESVSNMKAFGIKNVNLINDDAACVHDEIDKCNHFYFFNPFPMDVFKVVIDNVSTSLRVTKRAAVLYYVNPKFNGENFDDVILERTAFAKLYEFKFPKEIYVYCNKEYQARLGS